MPQHRAPSPSRSTMTVILTGATLGASALLPGIASARPLPPRPLPGAGTVDHHFATGFDDDWYADDSDWEDDDADDSARDDSARDDDRRHERPAHTRPMTSGERQYRNGCRQGYITDDCEQFDVTHLLRRGINPFL